MIQPVPASPMPATVSPALPGETMMAGPGEMTETLDFSALLALEGTAGEVTGAAAKAAAMPETGRQTLAAEAAVPGKILPPALPEAAADAPLFEGTEPAAEPALDPVLALLVATAPPPAQPHPEATAAAPEPAQGSPTPRPVPAAPPQVAAALVPLADLVQPERIRTAAAAPSGAALAEAPAIERPAAASDGARRAATTPVPAEEVRLDLARLGPLSPRSELRLPGEATLAQAAPIEGSTAGSQPVSANPAPAITLPAAQSGQTAVRPHDFSALIDRLTAAREALAPHSVAITVAHQDFGPVRLRFRNEDTGLSVAMASADPGFARAAAAAPLPVLPASASDQSGLNPQRGDGGQAQSGSAGGSGSSGNSGRGASPDRREDQPRPRHLPTREHAADRADARRGIFA